MYISRFFPRFFDKLAELAKAPLAWVGGLLLFIADAFSAGMLIVYIVVIAAVIDLVCGIAVSIKEGSFTESGLMRQTVEKVVVYGAALIVFLCLDKVVEAEAGLTVEVTSGFVGAIITLTESVSYLASLLILFPNNPFLRLMQKFLTGELARKLNCSKDEVAKVMAAKRKKQGLTRGKNGRFVKKS